MIQSLSQSPISEHFIGDQYRNLLGDTSYPNHNSILLFPFYRWNKRRNFRELMC
jgi:hypothetical protein